MRNRRRILLAALFLLGLAMGAWWAFSRDGGPTTQPAELARRDGRPVLRVLFIGNSLTQWNDLPGIVEAMSRSAPGGSVIEAGALLVGGADLGDHWRNGAQKRIAEGDWDFVVLQQGPSSLPESRQALLEYARTYAPAIRAAGARPAFYMVWPEERHLASFDRSCQSYRLAAAEVDGLLLPAGEAWRAAWRRDESMPLYGPDRFHPSPAGTYLAALVIAAQLTGRPPTDFPAPAALDLPQLGDAGLSQAQVGQLKESAAEALAAEAATTRPGG